MNKRHCVKKKNKQDIITIITICIISLIIVFTTFWLGRISVSKNNDQRKENPTKKTKDINLIGQTYSTIYKLKTNPNLKEANITHAVTIFFKNSGVILQKDEQINSDDKSLEDYPNKTTIYSANIQKIGNMIQGKVNSLVEAKYKSAKELHNNLPYDVRARGEAFDFQLKDGDPKQIILSIDKNQLTEIFNNGSIANLVKSKEQILPLKEYADSFAKQRDNNPQANSQENSSKNKLVQTQINSDGVSFLFGYFSNDSEKTYSIDTKITNPTNKTQLVTLEKIIFQGTNQKYTPQQNYQGQIEIPPMSSKILPALFQGITYNDIFNNFTIYYDDPSNIIIDHQGTSQLPANFNEGHLNNSGV